MTAKTSPHTANHYALATWFSLAQGDETLLVRVLSDTAGLKGWLSRPLHDQLSNALLADVAQAGVLESFDRAAVYLLSQMPQYSGPENDADWQQWLEQWQVIHKDKTPAEQLDALPERFNNREAETAMRNLLPRQHETTIPLTIKD